jgi:predicted glycosyltransferase
MAVERRRLMATEMNIESLKEWAYLNPRTFVPKVEMLEKYGVKPKEYMFLREVSVGTINYAGQASGAILGIKDMIPTDMRVLFSLEEKKRRDEYPADWILLQEPIEDIHSLIYYSAGLVSSGDSMAREAALLGVPSYYLGIRYSMPANAAASKVASLQNQRTMGFEEWIAQIADVRTTATERSAEQDALRAKIDEAFIDINAYMLKLVEGVKELKSEGMKE